jgi:hypothetical protein
MDIGRKIYYGKSNGIAIWDKGEMSGSVRETTLEEDMITMPILALISDAELGICQLEFGELAEQFAVCQGYIIDSEIGKPIFA